MADFVDWKFEVKPLADGGLLLRVLEKETGRHIGSLHGKTIRELMETWAVLHAFGDLIILSENDDDFPDELEVDFGTS